MSTERELCKNCGRPLATDRDYDETEEGERDDLCWSPWGSTAGCEDNRDEIIADLRAKLAGFTREPQWVFTHDRLPREETVVEVAVVGGNGKPYRAFGCRVDGGEGWTWALANGLLDDPDDCECDDDYDVFAWREPTPLPCIPEHRRFQVLRSTGEEETEVAVVVGIDERDRLMGVIGEAARWAELPPAAPAAPTGKE